VTKRVSFKPDKTLWEVLEVQHGCRTVVSDGHGDIETTGKCHRTGKRYESFKSDDYALEKALRKRLIEQLGLKEEDVKVDLFASHENRQCELYCSALDSAFIYDWEDLCEWSGGWLWANPPFDKGTVERVLEKLSQERVKLLLLLPKWTTKQWYKELLDWGLEKITVDAKDTKFVQGKYRRVLDSPAWDSELYKIDTTRNHRIERCLNVLNGWTELSDRFEDLQADRRNSENEIVVAKCCLRSVEGSDERKNQLILSAKFRRNGGTDVWLESLIDTGAQVNLIRKGLIKDDLIRSSGKPIRLVTATGEVIAGAMMRCKLLYRSEGKMEKN